jgi:hypothetical protein
MAVTGAAAISCLKRRLYNVLPNVTYSSSHLQAGTPVINTQSTLRTAPDLCKNVSFEVLCGSNGNSYIVSDQSDACLCVYTHTHTHTHTHTLVTISGTWPGRRN